MAKLGKILKFGYGVLDDLGFFSPTEKAIDALGQDKFPAKDLYRFEDDKPAGLLSKFGRPVQDEMVFTGLEDKILGLPEGSTVTSKELKDLGYNIVIYPVTTQRLAMKSVEDGLKSIFKDGHQNNIIDKMQTRKRLYELVEYEKYNTPDKKITDFKTEGHE